MVAIVITLRRFGKSAIDVQQAMNHRRWSPRRGLRRWRHTGRRAISHRWAYFLERPSRRSSQASSREHKRTTEHMDAMASRTMDSKDHHRAMGSRTEVDAGTTEEQVPLEVTRMAAA